MKLCMVHCLVIAATAVIRSAAADPPAPLDETPRGSGTQADRAPPEDGSRVRPGAQADAALGTGVRDVYAVGVSGRLGYAFASGPSAGGAITQFVGGGNDYATFVGAEGGYKFFPTYRWEMRPYAFIGPAFLHRAGVSETDLALQPSVASAYHFGPWFLSADARAYVIPSPGTLAVLVGGGAGF
jgi:hypothetical protein